jgi:hypothetical protein
VPTWCVKTGLERRAPYHLTLFTAIMCDPAPEVQRFSCACTVCHVGEPSTHGSDLRFITIPALVYLLKHRCSVLRTGVEHMLLLLCTLRLVITSKRTSWMRGILFAGEIMNVNMLFSFCLHAKLSVPALRQYISTLAWPSGPLPG